MTALAPATNGKVPHSTFLSDVFVMRLKQEARKLHMIEKARSKKEWLFGEIVNAEWETLCDEIRQEVTKEGYLVECSYWINESAPFPLVAASGETLRRWCEVAASYQEMPGLEPMREVLSFDHFTKARRLANKGKVSVPAFALAKAIEKEYTVDEMMTHFDPPQTLDEYDRANGSLDALMSYKFEWLAKDAREKVVSLLREIQKIMEAR